MPLALLLSLLAPTQQTLPANVAPSVLQQLVASGRALPLESPDARVAPPLHLTPGPPPLLSFRFYEGKQRHRFGDVDIMLDDAGH